MSQTIKDCLTVWNRCLEVIREEVSDQSYQTWFAPIRPLRMEGRVLTIQVPSLFFYEWLEEHYVALLKKAIVSELGEGGKLEYSVVVDKGNDRHKPLAMNIPTQTRKAQGQQGDAEDEPSGQGPSLREGAQGRRSLQGRAGAKRVREYGAPNGKHESQAQPPTPKRGPKESNRAQEASRRNARPAQAQPPAPFSPFDLPKVSEAEADKSNLNPLYRFDNYIEGECNRLARSAGMAVVDKPGMTAFNPLVIYGGVGLGKTHLAQAIGNALKEHSPEKFVLYVSSERFTTQFIEALKNNSIQQFTNFYLQVDALIIDDIQFFAQKEKTQENFFHIFNHLHQSGKQIIMTSDRPPRDLKGLQERLLSRFKWGLTTDIAPPDYETRVAIVKTKTEHEGVEIPGTVVEYLAQSIDTNIRELEGVIISVIARASLTKTDIDLKLAKETILNIVKNTTQEITIDYIQEVVAEYFGVSIDQLMSKTRKKEIAQARQIAMFLSQKYTQLPLKSIGNHFGGRDHSTVVHASKAVSKKAEADERYSRMVESIRSRMNVKSGQ